MPVGQLHHARVGVTAKTMANHKSNVRVALRWFSKEHDVPLRGVPLSPKWLTLRDSIKDGGQRARLYGLMRYCSGRGIEPLAVNDSILDCYLVYRAKTTALAANDMARRSIARAWNAGVICISGWPKERLSEPALKARTTPAWEDFPAGLLRDVDAYLSGIQKVHRGFSGKRIRPCADLTIRTRKAELKAVACKAVALGLPIDRFTSLAGLLHPDVIESVIEAYWRGNGKEPSVFTVNVAGNLLSVARATNCLDRHAVDELDEIRAALEDYRRSGLTSKNLNLVRLVLTDGIWSEVVSLPNVLMQQARAAKYHSPTKAAVTAQLAVAIAILTFAPIRLGNLVAINIGENLIKPGGLHSPFRLVFPHYDTKNRVDLDFPLDRELSNVIDEYLHEFRPSLLRGWNGNWLFPGEAGAGKAANTLSTQLIRRIQRTVGIRITAHQFRHAAAAIYLKHRPGDYETVRRFLGHRSVQTTTSFYIGLQTTQATEEFGKIVREQMKFDIETA